MVKCRVQRDLLDEGQIISAPLSAGKAAPGRRPGGWAAQQSWQRGPILLWDVGTSPRSAPPVLQHRGQLSQGLEQL